MLWASSPVVSPLTAAAAFERVEPDELVTRAIPMIVSKLTALKTALLLLLRVLCKLPACLCRYFFCFAGSLESLESLDTGAITAQHAHANALSASTLAVLSSGGHCASSMLSNGYPPVFGSFQFCRRSPVSNITPCTEKTLRRSTGQQHPGNCAVYFEAASESHKSMQQPRKVLGHATVSNNSNLSTQTAAELTSFCCQNDNCCLVLKPRHSNHAKRALPLLGLWKVLILAKVHISSNANNKQCEGTGYSMSSYKHTACSMVPQVAVHTALPPKLYAQVGNAMPLQQYWS